VTGTVASTIDDSTQPTPYLSLVPQSGQFNTLAPETTKQSSMVHYRSFEQAARSGVSNRAGGGNMMFTER